MKKKLLVTLTVVMLMLACMPVMSFAGSEATDSIAAGSAFNDATPIELNRSYSDSLTKISEKDYYTFKLNGPGLVQLVFSNPMQKDSRNYWRVTIYDSAQNEIVSKTVSGNYTKTNVPDTGLPGGSYFVEIRSALHHSTDPYTFSVNFKSSDLWEKEINDTQNKASGLYVNNDYHGSLWSSGDKDFYTFTLDKTGVTDIRFTNPKQEKTGNYWIVTLFDGNVNEITQKKIGGGTDTTDFARIGLPAGTYLISVRSALYHSEDTYGLRVGFSSPGGWETEVNDSAASADTIPVDATISGTIHDSSDKDFFVFNVPSSGGYSVMLNTSKNGSTSTSYYVEIYDKNVQKLVDFSLRGTEDFGFISQKLSAGTHYVRVNCGSGYTSAPYKLTVAREPGKATKVKAKAGKKKAAVSWKKASRAYGYTVYRATKKNGKFKAVKTLKKTKFINKKLKRKKTYYYKVRAYRIVNGVTVYGDYSKTVKVKVK